MTTIRIHWRPKDGSPSAVEVDPATRSFALGLSDGPDFFLLPHSDDKGLDIVLANGLVEDDAAKQRGRLEGEVFIEVEAPSEETQQWSPLLHPVEVSIDDGRGHVLSIGQPEALHNLPEAYQAEIMRSWNSLSEPQKSDVALKLQGSMGKGFHFDDSKYANPDGAKEDRIIQSVWAGALAYSLGINPTDALAGATNFAKQQIAMRPCLYYDKNGSPAGMTRSDIWIDEKGLRKGYHGRFNRAAGGTGQLEDLEHLAPKRQFLAAAAGSPLGKLCSKFYVQAMLTRPGIKTVKVAEQARAIGYTLEMLVEANLAGVLNEDVAYMATKNVLDGLHLSRGVGVGGIPFMACWPITTVHTTHVGITEEVSREYFESRSLDWPFQPEWEEKFTPNTAVAYLKAREVEGEPYDKGELTTGPNGLQTLVNGTTVWGNAIIARGLAKVARRWPDLDLHGLDRDVGRFLVERGCGVGIDGDGKQIHAEWAFDSVAPRCWRVRQANAKGDGTTRWCVAGFLDLAEHLDDLTEESWDGPTELSALATGLRACARRIVENAPDLRLSDKGIAAIETAGLLSIGRFG